MASSISNVPRSTPMFRVDPWLLINSLYQSPAVTFLNVRPFHFVCLNILFKQFMPFVLVPLLYADRGLLCFIGKKHVNIIYAYCLFTCDVGFLSVSLHSHFFTSVCGPLGSLIWIFTLDLLCLQWLPYRR